MKIQMLETKMGSEDGRFVSEYVQGMEYEVSKELGEIFLANDVAILANEELAEEASEEVIEGDEAPKKKGKKK